MKYSAENGDRGDVTLDGAQLKGCVECDPDEGYVIIIEKDASGKILVSGDEIATKRIDGVVTFTPWPDGVRPKG